jgi:hypothetical protein
LCYDKEAFCVDETLFSVEGAKKISGMLNPGEHSEYRKSLGDDGLRNLVKLLGRLSRQGYCKVSKLLKDHDSLIHMLIGGGVAGQVERRHCLHKDWKKLFGERDNHTILVPSSTSLRLVIAHEMATLKVETPTSP